MQTLTVLHPLPNPHAFRRSQVQRFSRLDIESRVPGVDIANRICPELGGRVRVNRHLLAQRSVPRLCPIVLAESDEELLVSRETIRSEEHTSELQSLRHLVC